jgi:hypothetical protein
LLSLGLKAKFVRFAKSADINNRRLMMGKIFKTVSVTAIFAILLTATSCNNCITGEGDPVTRTVELSPFDALVISGSHDVTISQGNEQRIEITAPSNIIEQINQTVKAGTWEVTFDECVRTRNLQIAVTLPSLKSIRITGSGNVKSLSNLNFDELALSVTGSGDMDLAVNSRQVSSSVLGSGNITLRGSSLNHNMHIQGSGDINARNFETVNSKVEILGSGDADINATGQIEASITGSGDIRYKDTGARIVSDVTGSGDIVKR